MDLAEAFADLDTDEVAQHLLHALELSLSLIDHYSEAIAKLSSTTAPAHDYIVKAQGVAYAARYRLLEDE